MDAAGIDIQVLSFGSPGPAGVRRETAIPMARDANDRLFETVKAHPDGSPDSPRCRPLPRKPRRELERCVKQLGFKGAMIHGHNQGSFLDERKYWPIFERAEALDVPIYLHPALPHPDAIKSYFAGYEELARAGWGFAVDTSCHFLRLVFAGVFDAYPKLKIILGHLGEGLPFAMHRLDDHTRRGRGAPRVEENADRVLEGKPAGDDQRQLVRAGIPVHAAALGADRILFAVDWPYEANKAGMEFLKKISSATPTARRSRTATPSVCYVSNTRIQTLRVRSCAMRIGGVHGLSAHATPTRATCASMR